MPEGTRVLELIPSWGVSPAVTVATDPDSGALDAVPRGIPVAAGQAPPGLPGMTVAQLRAVGFEGRPGQAITLPGENPRVLFGVGDPAAADVAALHDAAAAAANAVRGSSGLVLQLPDGLTIGAATAAQALVEGALLARYRWDALKSDTDDVVPLTSLTILAGPGQAADAAAGANRGAVLAGATALARDVANCPPSMMNATAFAVAVALIGREHGLEVEVFDQERLEAMGCGGLLGVNAGSVDEARMIKLTYTPKRLGGGKLALVGKGIMYDSGGISLKPADAVHATMKNDMSGAGGIFAAMTVLAALDCPTAVTGYLMCTDNMPSGSATKLGDVLTIRGGTTVEVINTDAEGRLVMADALVLAREVPVDAIVDMATLTGACLRALGAQIAGVFGNDQGLVDQVLAAAGSTDEPAWQLPLADRYRAELDSDVADIKNMGGPNGAAIHAALFLADFVDGTPWAHLDIAGPAQNDTAALWRTRGCTGFGARLLAEFATSFTPTGKAASDVR